MSEGEMPERTDHCSDSDALAPEETSGQMPWNLPYSGVGIKYIALVVSGALSRLRCHCAGLYWVWNEEGKM